MNFFPSQLPPAYSCWQMPRPWKTCLFIFPYPPNTTLLFSPLVLPALSSANRFPSLPVFSPFDLHVNVPFDFCQTDTRWKDTISTITNENEQMLKEIFFSQRVSAALFNSINMQIGHICSHSVRDYLYGRWYDAKTHRAGGHLITFLNHRLPSGVRTRPWLEACCSKHSMWVPKARNLSGK